MPAYETREPRARKMGMVQATIRMLDVKSVVRRAF